jgi:hypothetical protein
MKNNNSAVALWRSYRDQIYGGESIPRRQERECSLAFYAGMEATFRRMASISNASLDTDESELEAAKRIEKFRLEIKTASMNANLDRSDGRS